MTPIENLFADDEPKPGNMKPPHLTSTRLNEENYAAKNAEFDTSVPEQSLVDSTLASAPQVHGIYLPVEKEALEHRRLSSRQLVAAAPSFNGRIDQRALFALLARFSAGEALLIQHSLDHAAKAAIALSITCDKNRSAECDALLNDAANHLIPGFAWQAIEELASHTQLKYLHTWQIRTAPLHVYKCEAKGEQQVQSWPQPCSVAEDTNHGAPLCGVFGSEHVETWANTRITFRLMPFDLNLKAAARLAELHDGLVAEESDLYVVLSDAPVKPWQECAATRRAAIDLAQAWITRPELGYAFDILVESLQPISELNLNLLAHNVMASQRKMDIVRTRLHGMPLGSSLWQHQAMAAPQPTFSDSIKPGQGIPCLMPNAETVITALGLTDRFDSPKKWPVSQLQPGDVLLGHTACKKARPVVLTLKDRLTHTAIVGASGTGKSTLLLSMIAQDLLSPTRPGMALIDPHGSLYEDALRLVPKSRLNDLVLIDVNDSKRVASISALGIDSSGAHARNSVAVKYMVNAIASMLDVLYEGKNTSGPLMRSHIRNAIELASWMPNAGGAMTIAARLIEDADFREFLLSKCQDEVLCNMWKGAVRSTSSENGWSTWVPYVRARFDLFQTPLMLRFLSSGKPTVNLSQCVRDGKLVFLRLDSSSLGQQEARLFGNIVMNQLYSGSTHAARGKSMTVIRPFHLYIDEASTMVSPATMRLWPEARKFGMSLTTANQNIAQLRGAQNDVADTLLANTATKLCFRLNTKDAHFVDDYYKPEISAAQLQRLPVFNTAASLSSLGEILPAFVLKVTRPAPPADAAQKNDVETQRLSYTTPLHEVIQDICKISGFREQDLLCAGEEESASQMDMFSNSVEASGDAIKSDVLSVSPSSEVDFRQRTRNNHSFERFVSLMHDALAFRMGSKWTCNTDDVQGKITFTKYYDPDANEVPSFKEVYARINSDTSLPSMFQLMVLGALETMAPHFWSDTESGASETSV